MQSQFILISFFFFFFQAEDGIRDRDVTGVQTCALPISTAISVRARRSLTRRRLSEPSRIGSRATSFGVGAECMRPRLSIRSEERRVGKECRARWVRG